jgi:hypothetical protein
MNHPTATPPSYRSDPVADILAAAERLDPRQQRRLIVRLKDLGILDRPRRGERYPARNRRIVTLYLRGLSPGQIGKRENMSRNAVRLTLRRCGALGSLAARTHCTPPAA